MNNNKYDGTIHPEEWVRQIQLSFYDKNNENTKNEKEIVNYCKLLIHPSIKISSFTNSFAGLIRDLKSDTSYVAFKKSVRKKLQELKFNNNINEDDENLKFLNNFQQLCYESEITEIGEKKKLFLNALPRESIQHVLIDNMFDRINSMEELFKYFYESFIEESKIIKDGSYITLKHISTGKYLSSCSETYDTSSRFNSGYLVFAGPTIPDISCVWKISKDDQETVRSNRIGKFSTIFYGDLLFLNNKMTGCNLYTDDAMESPASQNSRVSCNGYQNMLWYFKNTNSENPPYVKSTDIISLQCDQFVLRSSSDSTFTNDGKTYQEVACHEGRVGGNDKWCVEIIEQAN